MSKTIFGDNHDYVLYFNTLLFIGSETSCILYFEAFYTFNSNNKKKMHRFLKIKIFACCFLYHLQYT